MKNIIKEDLNLIFQKTKSLFETHFFRKSKILITGGTGFFGKCLLKSLLHLDYHLNLKIEIYILSRNPENFLKNNDEYKNLKRLIFINGDIRFFDYKTKKIDYIIHAATESDSNLNNNDPSLMSDTIISGTRSVLNFAKKQTNLKSFLFISSGAIYGKQPENITHINENHNFYFSLNSTYSSYSEGKRIAELLCSDFHNKYDIPIKIARCFAFVGPYLPLDKHFAIGNFISNFIKNENIIIKGDGKSLRSYMYTSDLVIWLFNILLIGENNKPYNVGSDESISILNLAKLVNTFRNNKKQIKVLDYLGSNSSSNYVPDIKKASMSLNLNLNYSINESISRTIKFHTQIN